MSVTNHIEIVKVESKAQLKAFINFFYDFIH